MEPGKYYLICCSALLMPLSVIGQPLSWCDPQLCPEGKVHIACNNNGKFHESCSKDATMVNLKPHRALILAEHNKRRNFIASGSLPGYYPATRMATMVWDAELEYLATLNLKTCHLEHDDCNHSYRFRNLGQNLCGVDRYRSAPMNVTNLVEQSLGLWFGEHHVIDSSFIADFRVTSKLEKYGHFVETVVDRNTHVGCAMMRFTNPKYPFLYIYNTACNYASVYAIGVPVYSAGEPASECRTGTNPQYPALCSVQEKYNPNYNIY
ncbi:antigen 5 like allergen Cul n 1 [Drosophila guanche]|uniref:Venom allergen-1 n=1 Tax=Drosophila guanche TaxID=7266 RepID=A0A3B0JH99_DROGU|nr:antigen 5 like allergen Cul n 1 [Drosophila guanche]SPP72729.1 blast:Venom allergen 5 [Drosophila guanche]